MVINVVYTRQSSQWYTKTIIYANFIQTGTYSSFINPYKLIDLSYNCYRITLLKECGWRWTIGLIIQSKLFLSQCLIREKLTWKIPYTNIVCRGLPLKFLLQVYHCLLTHGTIIQFLVNNLFTYHVSLLITVTQ